MVAQLRVRLAEKPPVVATTGARILIALWLYAFEDVLINRRIKFSHFVGAEAEEVDDFYVARGFGQVATVSVFANH